MKRQPPPPCFARSASPAAQGRICAALLAAAVAGLPPGPAAAQEADSLNPMQSLARTALDSFVQKPLFDPARQLPPPPPPVVAYVAPPPPPTLEPPPTLQLLGVVRGRHDMAIVHKDGNEKTVVLRTGDKLGGWTVAVRPPFAVTLSDGDRQVDFALFSKSGAGAPSSPRMPAVVPVRQRRQRHHDQ